MLHEGVRSKMAFFVFRPSSQDQKGLSEALNISFKYCVVLITKISAKKL